MARTKYCHWDNSMLTNEVAQHSVHPTGGSLRIFKQFGISHQSRLAQNGVAYSRTEKV